MKMTQWRGRAALLVQLFFCDSVFGLRLVSTNSSFASVGSRRDQTFKLEANGHLCGYDNTLQQYSYVTCADPPHGGTHTEPEFVLVLTNGATTGQLKYGNHIFAFYNGELELCNGGCGTSAFSMSSDNRLMTGGSYLKLKSNGYLEASTTFDNLCMVRFVESASGGSAAAASDGSAAAASDGSATAASGSGCPDAVVGTCATTSPNVCCDSSENSTLSVVASFSDHTVTWDQASAKGEVFQIRHQVSANNGGGFVSYNIVAGQTSKGFQAAITDNVDHPVAEFQLDASDKLIGFVWRQSTTNDFLYYQALKCGHATAGQYDTQKPLKCQDSMNDDFTALTEDTNFRLQWTSDSHFLRGADYGNAFWAVNDEASSSQKVTPLAVRQRVVFTNDGKPLTSQATFDSWSRTSGKVTFTKCYYHAASGYPKCNKKYFGYGTNPTSTNDFLTYIFQDEDTIEFTIDNGTLKIGSTECDFVQGGFADSLTGNPWPQDVAENVRYYLKCGGSISSSGFSFVCRDYGGDESSGNQDDRCRIAKNGYFLGRGSKTTHRETGHLMINPNALLAKGINNVETNDWDVVKYGGVLRPL